MRTTSPSALRGAPLLMVATFFGACATPHELSDVKMPVYLNDDVPKNLSLTYKVADAHFSTSNKEWTETESNTEFELKTKNGEKSLSPKTTQEEVKRTDKNIKDHLQLATKLGSTQGGAAILFGSWDLRAWNQEREDTLSGTLVVVDVAKQTPTDSPDSSHEPAVPVVPAAPQEGDE